MRIGENEPELLTTEALDRKAYGPVFSPDGRYLVETHTLAAGKNVGELLATARKQFGQRYRHERQFDIMVRKLIAQWGADKD